MCVNLNLTVVIGIGFEYFFLLAFTQWIQLQSKSTSKINETFSDLKIDRRWYYLQMSTLMQFSGYLFVLSRG